MSGMRCVMSGVLYVVCGVWCVVSGVWCGTSVYLYCTNIAPCNFNIEILAFHMVSVYQ